MLLSIITINYNNQAGLERTMASVLSQTYTNFEYLVIDGGSTDGSKALIEQYQNDLAYWVSEPDTGIYHAMNKGIKQAKGDYLFFLNSGDDFVHTEALEQISKYLNETDIIYFDIHTINGNSKAIKSSPAVLSFNYLHEDLPPHQATFIRKQLFDTLGYYDVNLKIVADWKFLILALIKHNASYKKVAGIYTNFYLGGISSNANSASLMQQERQAVLETEFPILLEDLKQYYKLTRILRNLRKSKKLKLLVKWGFIDSF